MGYSPPSLIFRLLLRLCLLGLGLLSLCGCHTANSPQTLEDKTARSPLENPLFAFDTALQPFAHQLRNLKWRPDSQPELFSSQLKTNSPQPPEVLKTDSTWTEWQIVGAQSAQPWTKLLQRFRWLERVELVHVEGDFEGGSSTVWRGTLALRCSGKKYNDHWAGLRGELEILWKQESGAWRVEELTFRHLQEIETPQPLFLSDLDKAISDPKTRSTLIDCPARRAISEFIFDPTDAEKASRVCDPYSELMNTHSGISVVDLDGDGLDDLFILRPYNTSIFLKNIGQGRFEDQTENHNLAFPGCTSAAFADFDNDGDPDLLLGRYRCPSLYLTNENGRFQESPEKLSGRLPDSVSSVSCADINGDGLVDAFLATHNYVQRTFVIKEALTPSWSNAQETLAPAGFVYPFLDSPEAETKHLKALLESPEANLYDNYPSQPSVLLINQGNGLLKKADTPAWAYRLNFQGTFSDIDHDGDADLIMANEAGPTELLRNESGNLIAATDIDPTFSGDSSTACSVADLGNDGRPDILLSRNRERPGRRVIRSPLASLSTESSPPPISLFSSTTAPGERGFKPEGFLWGGQFLDLNNDGGLDLHLATGLYSAEPTRPPYLIQDTLGHPGFPWDRANLLTRCTTSFSGNQRNLTYLSDGEGALRDISAVSGVDSPLDSRSVAVLDYNRDGWQDLVVTSLGFPAVSIHKNVSKERWPRHRSLTIRLLGGNTTAHPDPHWSNRDAIGARVEVKTSDLSMSREKFPWQGVASQNSGDLHFGLGDKAVVEQILVHWPSGKHTTIQGPIEQSSVTIFEKDGEKIPPRETLEGQPNRLGKEPKAALKRLASPHSELTLIVGWATWSKEREKWLKSFRPLGEAFQPTKLQTRLLSIAPMDPPESPDTIGQDRVDILPTSAASRAQFLKLAEKMGERLNPPAAFLLQTDGTVLRYFSEPPSVSDIAEMLEERRPHPEVERRLNLPAPTPLAKLVFPQAEMDPSLFRLVQQK